MKLLWIPHAGWHIPQRAHYFVRALAELHEVHVTDAVADFSSIRDYLSPRYVRNFFYRCAKEGRVTIHGIPRISPALYSRPLRCLNLKLFGRVVQHIIASHKIDVVVGTFLLPPPRAPRVVFDLFDENVAFWRQRYGHERYADEIAQTELAYLRTADAVVAASSVLVDKARAMGAAAPIYYIPNGIDLKRYAPASSARLRARLDVRGPVVGSLANYDNPEELAILLEIGRLLSGTDITVLIAGRGLALPKAQQQVRDEGLTNIRFMGYVPIAEAPDLVAQFDAGLCVYRKSVMDDARSPMRLLMYAAAGVPTVCTSLEEVRRMGFPNVITVMGDAPSFVEGIRQALTMKHVPPPQIGAYDMQRLVTHYERVLRGSTDDILLGCAFTLNPGAL